MVGGVLVWFSVRSWGVGLMMLVLEVMCFRLVGLVLFYVGWVGVVWCFWLVVGLVVV